MTNITVSTGHVSGPLTLGNGDNLYDYGTTVSVTVSSGGNEFVYAGGSADFTIVSGGGSQSISGGTAIGTMVDNGGYEAVSSGGRTSFTAVSSGGYEYVYAGGTAISATVNNGGYEYVIGGTASFTAVSGGGYEYVSAGGTATFTTVSGFENVASGGVAISTMVDNDGSEDVNSGGTASFTTVSSGGFQNIVAGTAISTTVNSGGTEDLYVSAIAISTTVNSGGFEYVSAGGAASDTTVSNGGSVVIVSGTTISTTVDSGGTEYLDAGGSASFTMLSSGGMIDVTFLSYTTGGSASVNTSGVLTVSVGSQTYTQQLSPAYAGQHFQLSQDTGSGTLVTAETVPCFLPGTLILTDRGEVAVEKLLTGDTIITLRGRQRRLSWIGRGRALATRGRRSAATPVIVRKGALSDNVPHHDLRITKGHSLYLDGVLMPVECLVNHRSILWDDRAQEVTVYHLELEAHDVLLANGAPAESYRDDGNRWLFQNANAGWDQPPKPPCAAVLTGGELVDAVWRRLLDRAGPRANVPITDDPDLHLMVDGRRLDATARDGDAWVFALPNRPDAVRIASRAAVPQELGIARDPRSLGVALWRVLVRQGTRFQVAKADDPRLVQGFHTFEADSNFVWTDGDAALPMALLSEFSGPVEIILVVACTAHYIEDGIPQMSPDLTGSFAAIRDAI
jgi:autotransporter passenger strand-loop-strand repeat protein